jgi:hypothetical protein
MAVVGGSLFGGEECGRQAVVNNGKGFGEDCGEEADED